MGQTKKERVQHKHSVDWIPGLYNNSRREKQEKQTVFEPPFPQRSPERPEEPKSPHKHRSSRSHKHANSYPPPRMSATTAGSASQPPPGGIDSLETLGDNLIWAQRSSWTREKEKILVGPYDYLYGHPGKDIRAQLITSFNAWLQVPPESLKIITKVVGMLHTSSLLIDDVEDSSVLRRGVPVAHSIFGTAQTINSANYIYFIALEELRKLKSGGAQAISIYTEELLNLHRGQGMDLFWRDTLTCPSENDYLEMVSNKTGGLFRLAIKLMQAESSRPARSGGRIGDINMIADSPTPDNSRAAVDCVPLVNTIGLLFQILDDHLNLLPASRVSSTKGMCEDLTEGKFSFPVIHAIRADPSNLELLNILKQKTTDVQVKKYAVSYMERKGSFEYSKRCIEVLRRKAMGLVDGLKRDVGGEDGEVGASGVMGILEKMVVENGDALKGK